MAHAAELTRRIGNLRTVPVSSLLSSKLTWGLGISVNIVLIPNIFPSKCTFSASLRCSEYVLFRLLCLPLENGSIFPRTGQPHQVLQGKGLQPPRSLQGILTAFLVSDS